MASRINVIFRYNNDKNIISITCLCNEKVSDVIERYRKETGDYDPTNTFIFNIGQINQYLSVSEAGLEDGSVIEVVMRNNLIGTGFSMLFSDVNKNKTTEISCSKEAPSYRAVTKGINIFGICTFKKCDAYKKEVVVMINKKKFDLIKERNELFCPECGSLIIPKTVGFYLCKYKIYGKKINNGREEYFENKIDEVRNNNTVKYFDPDSNGEVMMTQLIFEVIEYF